jgi:RES domain-containing protein
VGFELDDSLIAPSPRNLPRHWDRAPPYDPKVQLIGDAWVRAASSLALRVPASVLPSRANVLLNPAHRDMHQLREIERKPLPWPVRVVGFLEGLKKVPRRRRAAPRRRK